MAATSKHNIRQRVSSKPPLSWRAILGFFVRFFVFSVVVVVVSYGLLSEEAGPAARFNALFVLALSILSLVYLWYVSSRVRISVPEFEGSLKEHAAEEATFQVKRLSSGAARATVTNHAWLPILRAMETSELSYEPLGEQGEHATATVSESLKGEPFSLRARSTRSTALTNVFDHVGIFRLQLTGIRVYDLLGVFSHVREASGRWRIRVVPNIYRLSYGIPRQRRAGQDSLGLPRSPADALDYDRVRDYRPGDPLKTIHWKLVAHSQGELYTKLFETPTISSATLVIDPCGPNISSRSIASAYHLHDTMLEGGFSLLEHARENGITGRLRYVRRDGSLVETDWAGSATLGWFVETARRPSPTQEARELSIKTIQSLRNGHQGYVIFATSGLTEQSVQELIGCHRAGVALLVVHALPAASGREGTQQRAFDTRLQDVSIGVVGLTDGPQIVQEVVPS